MRRWILGIWTKMHYAKPLNCILRHGLLLWFASIEPSGKIEEIKRIADEHGAFIVEDADESLGAAFFVSVDGPYKEKVREAGVAEHRGIRGA